MEVGVLGPLQLRSGDRVLLPGRRLARLVLGVLALRPNAALPVGWLTDCLWDGRPPASAAANLRTYVSELRRLLRTGDPDDPSIESGPGGYTLLVRPDRLDALRFDLLLDEGRRDLAGGRPGAAVDRLRLALALWRGPVLGTLPVPAALQQQVRVLEGRRLAAVEEWIEARLAVGEHAAAAVDLGGLVEQYPLRERLWEQLMRGLYASGRQGEALGAYQRLYALLDAELGVQPGPPVRDLHQRMLRGDRLSPAAPPTATPPATAAPGATAAAPGTTAPGRRTPRQLPAEPAVFVGREAELAVLDGLAELDRLAGLTRSAGPAGPAGFAGSAGAGGSAGSAGPAGPVDVAGPVELAGSAGPAGSVGSAGGGGPVVISAISGTAGVGKTALALRWAHRSADAFPDGCLYVDLRGFGPSPALAPAAVLAGFLRGLGVDSAQLPGDPAELAARYRTEVADRRLLLVLDNAGSAEQVRPLLPGGSASRVIVTSRDSLAGLVARDGARRVELDLLPPAAALDLLRRLIGPRVDAEPAAAQALVEQCARLPLALRVAAELAAARRTAALAGLVAELRAGQLDALAAGDDPATAVRAVFSWSYRHLPAPAARVFRLLGRHPGRDFDSYAVAALAGTTVARARRLVGTLAAGYLVEPQPGWDRFRLHDLLRAYAAELAAGTDPADADAALARLLEHYTYAAALAMDHYAGYEKDRRPAVPRPATPVPPLPDAAAATAWLDAERANLVAAAGAAADTGHPGPVGRLSAILHRYLDVGGFYPEAELLHGWAVRVAAADAADRAGAARALCNLGVIYWRTERYPAALDHYRQALELARSGGERTIEIRALNNIGLMHEHLGEYTAALDRYRDAVAVARDTGDRPGEARGLDNLGNVSEYLGRYGEALEHKRQALAIASEIGDRAGVASTLNNLGNVYEQTGEFRTALAHYQQALAIAREIGYRELEGHALDSVGSAYRRVGDYTSALAHHREAVALARETGNNHLCTEALNSAGETLRQLGAAEAAADSHREALSLATALREPRTQARAHDGIARALAALGSTDAARAHWRQALRLYTDLGAPEGAEIAAQLS